MSIPASSSRRRQVVEWLTSRGTHVTAILAILIDFYETEVLSWDVATIRLSLIEDLKLQPSRLLIDKAQAGISLLTTDQIYRSPETFNAICSPFNCRPTSFENFVPARAHEAAWLLVEAALLLGTDFQTDLFSPEIRTYLGMILDGEGIRNPSQLFNFVHVPPRRDENEPADPVFTEMRVRREQEARQLIEQYVRLHLAELLRQLQAVPLTDREDVHWSRFLSEFRPRAMALAI